MSTQSATKPSLTLKRRLNAAPAKVFAAWTDPKKIMQWFGPEGITMLSAECDPHVGGRYRFVAGSSGVETHEVSGEFREVLPNERLVFTWAWKSTPERQSLVTVTLKPDGDGTLLTLTHEHFFDDEARDRHQHGWTGALEKLARLVA